MKKLIRILVLLFLGVVLLEVIGARVFLSISGALLFGWWSFLGRTLPQVTVNWNVIGMSILCSAILLWALQSFCAWFVRARCSAGAEPAGRQWKFVSTLAIFGITCALFLTTMGITGIVHQVAWLASSDEPWVQSRSEWAMDYSNLREYAMEVYAVLDDADWDSHEAQRLLWQSSRLHGRMSPQNFHVHFLTSEGRVTNAIVFPREPAARKRLKHFYVLDQSRAYVNEPWPNIEKYIPEIN